jgi:nitrous oxidase accessory protein
MMDQHRVLLNKTLIIGLILLFIGMSITPPSAQYIEKSFQPSRGTTITVDDEGDGDYTSIQDAIDNAKEGDIINVYSGIYEPTRIEKTIILEGISHELGSGSDTGKPVIQGDDRLITLSNVNECTIQGFELLHGEQGIIIFDSSNNAILENNISSCDEGITVHSFSEQSMCNYFIENTIKENFIGMCFEFSSNNIIRNNQISNNGEKGILLNCAHQNKIFNNTFKNNGFIDLFDRQNSGVFIISSRNNILEDNIFKGNKKGIVLIVGSSYNSIKYNNFLNNICSAEFYNSNNNIWDHNYWNRPRLFPKPIIGYKTVEDRLIPQINIDWHPAKEPYDIPNIS